MSTIHKYAVTMIYEYIKRIIRTARGTPILMDGDAKTQTTQTSHFHSYTMGNVS